MGKKGKDKGKEGELTNFPEESSPQLLSPRHLAIATSLLLVFSAFASLLINQDITGQATSLTMQRWRDEGLTANWGRYENYPMTNNRNIEGIKVVPNNYYCPEPPTTPPEELASTENINGCVNGEKIKPNGMRAVCFYMNKEGKITSTKCLTQ